MVFPTSLRKLRKKMSRLHSWCHNLASMFTLVLQVVRYVKVVKKLGSIVHIRCFSRFRTNQALTKQDSVAPVPLAETGGCGLLRFA